jgi:hypothetical protein
MTRNASDLYASLRRAGLLALALGPLLLAGSATASHRPGHGGGGGGGGGSTPPGTIYYTHQVAGSDVRAAHMDGDGNNKTVLPIQAGVPSLLLHGGKRWFLRVEPVDGAGYYSFDQGYRLELFAEREDGALKVQLTDDPALNLVGVPNGNIRTAWRWAPDETADAVTISGIANRWHPDFTLEPDTTGLYTATLRFDQNGDVLGLDAPPSFRVSLGTVEDDCCADGFVPDARHYSWSPDMTEVVADRGRTPSGDPPREHDLRRIDVMTGVATLVLEDAVETYQTPEWSPDGARIVFRRQNGEYLGGALESITPEGSGRQVLATDTRKDGAVLAPSWSPSSAFVLYKTGKSFQPGSTDYEADLWRMTAAGGDKKNLTDDDDGRNNSTTPLGWR